MSYKSHDHNMNCKRLLSLNKQTLFHKSTSPLFPLSSMWQTVTMRGGSAHWPFDLSASACVLKSVKTKNVWLQLKPVNLPVASLIYDTSHGAIPTRRSKTEQASLIIALFKFNIRLSTLSLFPQSSLELFPSSLSHADPSHQFLLFNLWLFIGKF